MDNYTKSILTVIAISLAIIAFKLPLASPARALNAGCGAASNPCYVDYHGENGLSVFVTNLQ